MKRILLLLVVSASLMLIGSAQIAHAYDPYASACDDVTNSANTPVCSPQPGDDPIAGPNGIITRAVAIVGWVIGVASVIMIMLGGLKYITSNGDANSISGAKNTILYALIGVVVFLLCQTIVIFVLNKL